MGVQIFRKGGFKIFGLKIRNPESKIGMGVKDGKRS